MLPAGKAMEHQMWYQILSWVLSITCTVKALIGLLFHQRFYAWDKKQYLSKRWPISFVIFLPYGIGLCILTWYATYFHYVKHGWILTATVSVAGLKLINIVFNWKKTSTAFVNFIDRGGISLWLLDIVVLVAGIAFGLLAIYVY